MTDVGVHAIFLLTLPEVCLIFSDTKLSNYVSDMCRIERLLESFQQILPSLQCNA